MARDVDTQHRTCCALNRGSRTHQPAVRPGGYAHRVTARSATRFDVAVIGAGPAGCSAAIAAVQHGASVVLLERHPLPRYKVCGGGLIGLSLAALPEGFRIPVRARVDQTRLTRRLGSERIRSSSSALFQLVMRDEFDAALAEHAAQLGADLRPGVQVDHLEVSGTSARVTTNRGVIEATAVVGADGSASRIARQVGASYDQVDLGLEAEIDVPPPVAAAWRDTALLDFASMRGGYAWVFPKGDRLTVGCIAARGRSDEQRAYLERFIDTLGLTSYPRARNGGHLTRCRAASSPLGAGMVLLAGDAAGLLEPWTREGISFALRSGALAGESAVALARNPRDADRHQSIYAQRIHAQLGREMALGRQALRAYEHHPGTFHRVLGRTGIGWHSFERLCRGETTLAQAGDRLLVRSALRVLGSSPSR